MIAACLRYAAARCIYSPTDGLELFGLRLTMMRSSLTAISMLLASAGALQAASSGWFETDGVRLQLVTEDAPNAAGEMRGVVRIALEPGWKTYWKDPGDAGVPPQIDTASSVNVSGVEIHFPPPKRFETDNSPWAGYGAPLDLPVTFKVTDPAKFTAIDANVFVGVCKDICIPVQAKLSVTPDPGQNAEAQKDIDRAFLALPAPATTLFGVTSFKLESDHLVATAQLPDVDSPADLFIASPSGWQLGAPKTTASGHFSVPIIARPKSGQLPASIEYTLINASRAVSGNSPLN